MGNYVSNTEVAAYLGINGSDDMLMADLDTKIEIAENLVEDFCRRTFVSETASAKYLNGSGDDRISCGSFTLRTLTSVEIVDQDEVVQNAVTYVVGYPSNPRRGFFTSIRYKDASNEFPLGTRNIKVTGNWGFATVPQSFKYGVFLTIKNIYDNINKDQSVLTEAGLGKLTTHITSVSPYHSGITFSADAIPPIAQIVLAQYRSGSTLNEEH